MLPTKGKSRRRVLVLSKSGRVNFHWATIQLSPTLVDYVIVHELAHLLEANHTAACWSIVRAKTPTVEKARSWLKEHGQALEDEI